jgi:S1-C subfamily serine protease
MTKSENSNIGSREIPIKEVSVRQLLLTTVVACLIFAVQEVSAQTLFSVPQGAAKVRPSVVQIIARRVSYDIFLRPVPSEGLASGIIYDSRGYILTNRHVVGEEEDVQVILPDGRKFGGEVMGRDSITDLAVIMIKGKDLPYASLGDSSKLEIGETVIAIGNALGLEGGPTVTVGVVSAVNRSIGDATGIVLSDLIQTDAAINPGNSGGPLINLKGEVVGINMAVIPSAHGVGFAIAINSAKPVAKELLEIGMVVRPWLGIVLITITPGLEALYDLPAEEGVLVARVEKGNPAAEAGLQTGDIITALAGERVKSVAGLRAVIAKKKLGDRVDLEINRDRKKFTMSLTLGVIPDELE